MNLPTRLTLTPIVLVGLMGAGKTSVGRRLAARVGVPFRDADEEIEKAAGCSIEDIFARFGEPAFRDGERKVIARLLGEGAQVLATGGGAFMDSETRDRVSRFGISVWLKADADELFRRVSRHSHRPLLKTANPKETLERLINQRYPIYAEADILVETRNESPDITVENVLRSLIDFVESPCDRETQKHDR